MAWVIAGCSPNSSGVGSASGAVGPGEGSEGDGTLDDGDGTLDDGDSSVMTTGADGTADGAPMDSGDGHPVIIISDGPTLDFGSLVINSSLDRLLTITNEGDAEATALQVLGLAGVFSVQGSDCPGTLGPGQSCAVTVSFGPAQFGPHAGELQLAFQDAGMPASASRPLAGLGVGMTGNLVINGGGEEGNGFETPTGWSSAKGAWVTTTTGVMPEQGIRTIVGGWTFSWDPDDYRLHQSISVAPLTTWGDAAGVRFYFRVHHRPATAGEDPTWASLRFLSGEGSVLESQPTATNSTAVWLESTGDWVAPANTHTVQVELACDRTTLYECNGHFDGVEVWAEWNG